LIACSDGFIASAGDAAHRVAARHLRVHLDVALGDAESIDVRIRDRELRSDRAICIGVAGR
jgi:hypothetical protein